MRLFSLTLGASLFLIGLPGFLDDINTWRQRWLPVIEPYLPELPVVLSWCAVGVGTLMLIHAAYPPLFRNLLPWQKYAHLPVSSEPSKEDVAGRAEPNMLDYWEWVDRVYEIALDVYSNDPKDVPTKTAMVAAARINDLRTEMLHMGIQVPPAVGEGATFKTWYIFLNQIRAGRPPRI